MSFNIAGLVINKNLQNDIAQIETLLGEKLVFDEDVDFDDAIESFKEDEYCDIYFSEQGTVIFLSMDTACNPFSSKDYDTFSFVLSEMAMMFSVNYVKQGNLVRSLVEANGSLMENTGEPLEFEQNEDDISALIHHLFTQVLGKSFFSIDAEADCYRYTRVV